MTPDTIWVVKYDPGWNNGPPICYSFHKTKEGAECSKALVIKQDPNANIWTIVEEELKP